MLINYSLRGRCGGRALVLLFGGGAVIGGCRGEAPRAAPPPPMPEERYRTDVEEAAVEPVAADLEVVWDNDFAPGGRIFVYRITHPRPSGG